MFPSLLACYLPFVLVMSAQNKTVMKLTAKGDSTKLSIVLVHGIWFDDLELYNVIGGLQKAVAEKTHQLSLLNTTLEEQKQAIATLVHLQKIGITTTEIQQLVNLVGGL